MQEHVGDKTITSADELGLSAHYIEHSLHHQG